jgi:NAD(P)-dependent dehydrogenase (short-subunit alcohol dehydrogenase family)
VIAVTSPWTPTRLGDLTGKRVIVTGATNGVGLGTAHALAKAGAHVILAVRNIELGKQRAAEIGGSTEVVKLDLADLSSVREFPTLIDGDVDILINNAGAITNRRADTVDGFEMTLGTNLSVPTRTNRRRYDSTTCICARTNGRDWDPMRSPSWR